MYRCGGCQREVELAKDDPVRCPFCGYKILFKIRPGVVKRVKSR
ncbi:DNA-directed RNA polymerase subunit P [Candidatus Pyrohabitans sp.]